MAKAASAMRLVHFEDWMDPAGEKLLAARPDVEVLRLDPAAPEAENREYFRGAHGYMVGSRGKLAPPWYPEDRLFAGCPNLLTVCVKGSGFEAVDVDACTRAGIAVCNQRGGNREAVAEHTVAMMIDLAKNITRADRMMRRKSGDDRVAFKGHDIYGKVVGIVGLGYIGERVAAICRTAFAMEVLAYSPRLSADAIRAKGAAPVNLPDLLARADFVTLHGTGGRETQGLIGREQFALMKPEAYFINTARAIIHDEAALAWALAEGRIAGAALDVFSVEPPPHDHPLLQFDNVIANPHLAGVTYEARANLSVYAAEQFLTIFAGKVPPRLVNHEVWPRYRDRFERIVGFRPPELP